jgi:hypothetical protein
METLIYKGFSIFIAISMFFINPFGAATSKQRDVAFTKQAFRDSYTSFAGVCLEKNKLYVIAPDSDGVHHATRIPWGTARFSNAMARVESVLGRTFSLDVPLHRLYAPRPFKAAAQEWTWMLIHKIVPKMKKLGIRHIGMYYGPDGQNEMIWVGLEEGVDIGAVKDWVTHHVDAAIGEFIWHEPLDTVTIK